MKLVGPQRRVTPHPLDPLKPKEIINREFAKIKRISHYRIFNFVLQKGKTTDAIHDIRSALNTALERAFPVLL